jgi:adenine phosphoribosyltransferase
MPPAFDFRSLIRTVPDFPRAGVRFRDITTLLKDGAVFHAVVDEIASAYRTSSVGKVAAIEARGFIVGAAVAHALRAGLVPVRKQGKLPAECLGRDYTLEYGVDRLELHRDAVQPRERVLLVDDLVATRGNGQRRAAPDTTRRRIDRRLRFCRRASGVGRARADRRSGLSGRQPVRVRAR